MAINWMKPFNKLIKLLKILGLWLDKSSSKCSIAIAVILHVLFVEIFMIFGTINLINVQKIVNFFEGVGFISFYFMNCTKSLHFVYNKNKIESMMKGVKELIEHESWIEKQNEGKLKRRIKQVEAISKTFLTMAVTAIIMSSLIPFFTHKLPLKMWFPYDYSNNETLFWLTVAYQDIASYWVIPTMITFEIFPIFFMCYLTGIIEELSDRMEKVCGVKIVQVEPKSELSENEKLVGRLNVVTMRKKQIKVEPKAGTSQMNQPKPGTSLTYREIHEKDENLEELLKCIEIQQKIKNLIADVNNVYGKLIWFQGFINTIMLCMSVFSLTVVSL
jgi:7tm Odorant receptor